MTEIRDGDSAVDVGSPDPFDPNTWSEEQKWYFNTIENALAQGQDLRISNGKTEHAVFLVERFLSHADSSVRLFSGRLSRNTSEGVAVYANPHVLKAVRKALGSGVRIEIVLEEELDAEGGVPTKHPFVRTALDLRKEGSLTGLLLLLKADPDALDDLRKHDFQFHWMTMDDRAYRLETDTENTIADVNFGQPELTGALNGIFGDVLLANAAPIYAVAP